MCSVVKCRRHVRTACRASLHDKEGVLMANMNDMMKQAQQMQNRLLRAKEEAANKTVEASAGGNMVTVVVNGRPEVVSLRIDPTVVSADDTEMLQDLVIAAVNEG